ncbi:PspA/IM30 family protein [Corynebacterium sp. 320]|uniref:PspA/IM30 family protein n=1 Tax=Corynebacterium TaxID=1716 RepID=UPI00125CAB5C|nr:MULTISPECIES: PspA/IM30 family protein [Corynebacterium]KAB1502763.1 PspA/IM30 family protein [Corynebacterium sp. 320]KAB1550497.1 PspA/IM30 family protein [Corynebacterium sp. 319]KAB1554773.1 PspA/IM30 family protein [Corynebacterium sp. 321]KAB3526426.1 PspA/IM30 family protein [Corynebacterium sp. 250]KAB3539745.1 PspA/IM30 family protein [Corynebacterium sp. 366]
MANPLSKGWKYLKQSLDSKIDANADPKIQIQQALEAAKKQHAQVTEAAAAVIGNRNQLEMKMHRLQEDQKKLAESARQAIQQADAATAAGDAAKAQQLNQTAEVFATQLVTVEQELEDTKTAHAAAVDSAKQAEQQQKQSEARLQEQMAQINQLNTQIEQAKMQEATADSVQKMQGLTTDDNVPSLDGVRDKIERRYATALGAQELAESSVDGRMAELEQATTDFKASSRLEQIRAEMTGDAGELGGSEAGELPEGHGSK